MKKWIALEQNTGIFDGYYRHKIDAVNSADYLTQRFVGSNWNVVNKSWTPDKRLPFWRTDGIKALKTLFDDVG